MISIDTVDRKGHPKEVTLGQTPEGNEEGFMRISWVTTFQANSKYKVLEAFLACLRNSKERVSGRVRGIGMQTRFHVQIACVRSLELL